jgi:hypothetical protein
MAHAEVAQQSLAALWLLADRAPVKLKDVTKLTAGKILRR